MDATVDGLEEATALEWRGEAAVGVSSQAQPVCVELSAGRTGGWEVS